MAYTTPTTQLTNVLVTATTWNQDLVENIIHLAEMLAGAASVGALPAASQLRGVRIGAIQQYLGSPDLTPTWLPLTGDTVGSASSGATYGNDDYEAIFEYLWTNLDTITLLTSVGGASSAGASAADDWTANKRIELPDARGRVPAAVNDGSGRLYAWGDDAGGTGGSRQHALTSGEVAAHTHTVPSHTHSIPSHTHSVTTAAQYLRVGSGATGGSYPFRVDPSVLVRYQDATSDTAVSDVTTSTSTSGATGDTSGAWDGTTGSTGSGDLHNNIQPTFVLGRYYIYTGLA